MKKIIIALATVVLFSCNDNAENQPTDLDRTKNNDTSVVPIDSLSAPKIDSTDTARIRQ